MKNPRDYPLNQWMEMGDDCDCGAPREVMITSIHHETLFVTKRANHRAEWHDGEEGLEEETDIMAWEFNGRVAIFGDTRYPVLSGHGNGVPCLKCWRLTDLPILLFLKEGKDGELAFCKFCVEKYGMLKMMVKS